MPLFFPFSSLCSCQIRISIFVSSGLPFGIAAGAAKCAYERRTNAHTQGGAECGYRLRCNNLQAREAFEDLSIEGANSPDAVRHQGRNKLQIKDGSSVNWAVSQQL
jgi:hypothetical protein